MKSFPRSLIAISVMIICILNLAPVFALDPYEASVSLSGANQAYYQGDTATIQITFQSNSSDELQIYGVGLQFDWMAPDSFYGHDLSASPISIIGYGVQIFDAITIPIPPGTSVGEHGYFVGIDGVQNDLGFVWDSPSFTVQILDAGQKAYTNLLLNVSAQLNAAINATYKSAEAQSLFQQAKDTYSEAISLASEEKYQEAILTLEFASDYLTQAEEAEQMSDQQGAEQQQLLLYLAIIVIVITVMAVIVVLVLKKRKKKPESAA